MKINRDFYLNKLINKINNGFIKIVTGLRRCGKSYLLFNIFKSYLLEHNLVEEDDIISIQLDRRSFQNLRNPDNLDSYIKNKIIDDKQYFLFIDEVQLCKDFESVLIDFLYESNIDIYVTGSNSKMLSKDIITEFRGRGDQIRLNPLTFKEIYDKNRSFDDNWNEYCTFGGMPMTYLLPIDVNKIKYLKELFMETYVKDIKDQNNLKMAHIPTNC